MYPVRFLVSVVTSGLGPGLYSGNIKIVTQTGALTIPVTLVVTTQAIVVSPTSLTFTYALGGAVPVAQALFLSGSPPGLFSATVSKHSYWLKLGASSVSVNGGVSGSVS